MYKTSNSGTLFYRKWNEIVSQFSKYEPVKLGFSESDENFAFCTTQTAVYANQIRFFYHSRMRVGNNFSRVCLCVVQAITF